MKPSRVSDTETFPLAARSTGTAINGGEGYSVVPDLCMVNVDVRADPGFRLPSRSKTDDLFTAEHQFRAEADEDLRWLANRYLASHPDPNLP